MEAIRATNPTTTAANGPSLRDDIAHIKQMLEEKDEPDWNGNGKKPKKPKSTTPRGWKRQITKARRQHDKVLVFYLNMKGVMEKPKLVPILPGDIIMLNNKAYDANPEHMWTIGKKGPKAFLIREIDRRPVSNSDYEKVKADGFGTDSDEILIKATMQALKAGLPKGSGKIALIVIIIIVAIIAIIMFNSSGAPPAG